jgi:hypothetical protein
MCTGTKRLTTQMRGAGRDVRGAKRVPFLRHFFLGGETIYRKRSIGVMVRNNRLYR